jgi:hypothetical protein
VAFSCRRLATAAIEEWIRTHVDGCYDPIALLLMIRSIISSPSNPNPSPLPTRGRCLPITNHQKPTTKNINQKPSTRGSKASFAPNSNHSSTHAYFSFAGLHRMWFLGSKIAELRSCDRSLIALRCYCGPASRPVRRTPHTPPATCATLNILVLTRRDSWILARPGTF